MYQTVWPGNQQWPLWQRLFFRFLFVYFILMVEPWSLFSMIPGVSYVYNFYNQFVDWLVQWANTHLFKTYKQLVPINGSGDTSWAYTQLKLYLLLALFICLVWTAIDRKREHYNRLAYWLRIVLRYFLIFNCLSYGFAKVFLQQMPFPSLSQLATPLGDLLPMRLSWMFMGYSDTYQFFTGLMEVAAGLFLFFRRTSTFGTLLAAGIFANVFMMNISYDIPVKLYSLHLLLAAVLLLLFDYKRILHFFFSNRNADSSYLYDVRFPKKWMRIGRIVSKLFVLATALVMPLVQGLFPGEPPAASSPIPAGLYDVPLFIVNNDTVPITVNDTLRWRDVVFEANGRGSVNTTDTLFRQVYRRGYFNTKADSAKQTLAFSKSNWDFQTFDLFTLQYEMPDSNKVILKGKIRNDSVYAVLTKSKRHFQLAERQFHWLSEYNR